MGPHIKSTVPGKEDAIYEVMAFDPATKQATLRTPKGAIFHDTLTKAKLQRYRYEFVAGGGNGDA